jgi:carbonic anhydrase/acetyltransferase-like protein (isoleucine patch superfamily)
MRTSIATKTPTIAPSAWIAPNATIAGDVTVGDEASVFYAAVLRAELDRIVVGAGSNIQDGCVIHVDRGFPATIGTGVTVGHRAILHGCAIADDALVGMGAIVMNGASIGSGSIVAAGSVVLQGTRVPPNSLVAGIPAAIRRETTAGERQRVTDGARTYRQFARLHALATGTAAS